MKQDLELLFHMQIFERDLLFSFTFNSYYGTSSASVEIAKKSVAIHTGCGKDANEIAGTS